jgi:hypothetical protein
MNQNVIKNMIAEMEELNRRGEYGGRAAQVKRDLQNNVMLAGFSSVGNSLYRKSNGRRTTDFETAVKSYQ